jgi:hypothetical protein
MLDKTKRLAPAIALLTVLVSLPIAQVQANANVKQDDRTTIDASRSAERYAYASVNYNKKFARTYQKSVYKWGDQEYGCLVSLWNHESGWRVNAHNPSSGAHGIPQSLPGSKMASAGPNWISNPHTQIKWGLKYIKNRYTTPCGAWSFWQRHHWY